MLIYHPKKPQPGGRRPQIKIPPTQPTRGARRTAPPMMRAPRGQLSGLGFTPAAVQGAASLIGVSTKSAKAVGAAGGAAAGAQAGSMILPGIGTAIGAVVGAIVGLLGAKKPPSVWNQSFQAFKPGASLPAGRQIDLVVLRDAFYYLWSMESHGLFRLRKQFGTMSLFLKAMAERIAGAALGGQLSNTDTAETIYNRIIGPWVMGIIGAVPPDQVASVAEMVTAFIDKYLYDEPLALQTYINAQGKSFPGTDYVPIPKLSDVLNAATARSAPTPAPAPTTGAGLPAVVPIAVAPTQSPVATATPLPMTTNVPLKPAPTQSVSPGVILTGILIALKVLS